MFPEPGLRHYVERDPAATLPEPMPYDEPVLEDRNPWSWFPWVSPDMNEPHEETYVTLNTAQDCSAVEDTVVQPAASPLNGVSGPAGMWGTLKRKFVFTSRS